MGRRTQQRRRRRVEELIALRHDEREFRRRWMARVEAWCKGLEASAAEVKGNGTAGAGRAAEVIESVMKELAEIGEPVDGALAMETRRRLEEAGRRRMTE